ncbi:hypothetical protein ACHAWF_007052 [Thalassiosira exigua]
MTVGPSSAKFARTIAPPAAVAFPLLLLASGLPSASSFLPSPPRLFPRAAAVAMSEPIDDAPAADAVPHAAAPGTIPTLTSDPTAKASDFANYFCAYAQLYHQKQMLTDHHRMAAYHAAIAGNREVFEGKVVMDVGTGSGILAVWAAQAGARRVYAIEYTDMAEHARRVVKANNVDHIVTVIQGAVEDVILPEEDWDEFGLAREGGDDEETSEWGKRNQRVVDVILSEWMGYFLLRESMLDSLVRARDTFLKPTTGLMMPSHATMLLAPVTDEEERKAQHADYAAAMEDWKEFADTTQTMYGVDMRVLERDFDREQREWYVLSGRWAELPNGALLAEPVVVKEFDMHVCTVEDARGVGNWAGVGGAMEDDDDNEGEGREGAAPFDFEIQGRNAALMAVDEEGGPAEGGAGYVGPVSGFAGWFSVDFKSRTDDKGRGRAPDVPNPAYLSTGPEMGYTHWGQQVFHLPSAIPLLAGQTTRIRGAMEMARTKESARLYNVRFQYETSRRKTGSKETSGGSGGGVLMKGRTEELVYQMP